MMFSTTLSKEIRVTCKKFMADLLEIFVDETKLTLHGLQHYVKLQEDCKLNELIELQRVQLRMVRRTALGAGEVQRCATSTE